MPYDPQEEFRVLQRKWSVQENERVQMEREKAAKQIDAADKSVRKKEKEFVTGSVKGVGASIVEGAGWVLDVLMSNPKYQFGQDQLTSFEQDLRTYFDSKMQDKPEAERQGYDAGKFVGMLLDPGPGAELGAAAAVGKKVKKVLSREEEIAKLATEQAGDIAAWKKRGEFQNPGYLFEQHGVPPSRIGEKNVGSFRAGRAASESNVNIDPESGNVLDDTGNVMEGVTPEDAAKVDRKEQAMQEYSQTEGNPFERVGDEPQGFPQAGRVMEEHGLFASRLSRVKMGGKNRRVWVKDDIDPEAMDAYVAKQIQRRTKLAAKNPKAKEGTNPKYIIYDTQSKESYSIVLDKNNKIKVSREGRYDPMSEDVAGFDPAKGGDPRLVGKKIEQDPDKYGPDEIIDGSDPDTGLRVKTYLEKKVREATENPEKYSQVDMLRGMQPAQGTTKWGADADDVAVQRLGPDAWDGMTGREREAWIEDYIVNELLPGVRGNFGDDFDPTKWKTPPKKKK